MAKRKPVQPVGTAVLLEQTNIKRLQMLKQFGKMLVLQQKGDCKSKTYVACKEINRSFPSLLFHLEQHEIKPN